MIPIILCETPYSRGYCIIYVYTPVNIRSQQTGSRVYISIRRYQRRIVRNKFQDNCIDPVLIEEACKLTCGEALTEVEGHAPVILKASCSCDRSNVSCSAHVESVPRFAESSSITSSTSSIRPFILGEPSFSIVRSPFSVPRHSFTVAPSLEYNGMLQKNSRENRLLLSKNNV